MKSILVVSVCILLLMPSVQAGTISYSYDEQNRLSGVNYDNQASVLYRYDKASNMTKHEALTQPQYLQPFLLFYGALQARPLIHHVAINAQYGYLLVLCI